MGQFVKVAKLSEIPDGGSTVVSVGKKEIALFRTPGGCFAIDDLCPHMGASLSGGFVEDGIVTCPWHYWRFRLADGAWADNPRVKTGCYAVQIEGDEVRIEISDGTPR